MNEKEGVRLMVTEQPKQTLEESKNIYLTLTLKNALIVLIIEFILQFGGVALFKYMDYRFNKDTYTLNGCSVDKQEIIPPYNKDDKKTIEGWEAEETPVKKSHRKH